MSLEIACRREHHAAARTWQIAAEEHAHDEQQRLEDGADDRGVHFGHPEGGTLVRAAEGRTVQGCAVWPGDLRIDHGGPVRAEGGRRGIWRRRRRPGRGGQHDDWRRLGGRRAAAAAKRGTRRREEGENGRGPRRRGRGRRRRGESRPEERAAAVVWLLLRGRGPRGPRVCLLRGGRRRRKVRFHVHGACVGADDLVHALIDESVAEEALGRDGGGRRDIRIGFPLNAARPLKKKGWCAFRFVLEE